MPVEEPGRTEGFLPFHPSDMTLEEQRWWDTFRRFRCQLQDQELVVTELIDAGITVDVIADCGLDGQVDCLKELFPEKKHIGLRMTLNRLFSAVASDNIQSTLSTGTLYMTFRRRPVSAQRQFFLSTKDCNLSPWMQCIISQAMFQGHQ